MLTEQLQFFSRDRSLSFDPRPIQRRKSTDSAPRLQDVSTPPSNPSRFNRLRGKRIEREFFESVLRTTTTKREAKGFLSRFKSEDNPVAKANLKEASDTQEDPQLKPQISGSRVNLGTLYSLNKAVQNSPVFTHSNLPNFVPAESAAPLHVAVVKLRAPQDLSDETLGGIVTTLDQLARLGVLSVLVVDIEGAEQPGDTEATTENWRSAVYEQSTRIVDSIEANSKGGGRLIDQSLGISDYRIDIPYNIHIKGGVEVQIRNLLVAPLRDGKIPVVPPIAYSVESRMHRVNADDVMLALTREFSGITAHQSPSNQDDKTSPKTDISLDRIIVLDPLGGIPDSRRPHDSYIFINLEQEYEDIHNALLNGTQQSSKSVMVDPGPASSPNDSIVKPGLDGLESNRHLQTLECIQRCLTLLPPSSSALLTTPAEVSGSALRSSSDIPATGVRTRPKKNPLIHNILTDKPLVSSSLPAARLRDVKATTSIQSISSTFFKRGIPVTLIPDPRIHLWTPPGPNDTPLRLKSDPRIDFSKLVHLIEDSFGRPLDVQHYLNRIESRIAGIIIAGNYEGGAILTWEQPHGRPGRPPVPYLDKFAVLRRSQGSGGVADIMFNAMVRTCFPHGVVWRSRRENPVNKWYFERASGTWRVPETGWTMFWTGNGVDFPPATPRSANEDEERWRDYVAVCANVQASWADQKPPD
jgi:amino-acid N-acetyltransferase